ncbi:MAG: phenylalanine--tRNA ligase subunit beta [Pseudomonadota bacterium]
MQFSEQRLRALVNPAVDTATLAHQLTMAGLEVDAIVPVAPAFSGVVIGEIISAEQHPNADKLRVTLVNIGAEQPLQIVCGASNARPGIRIPVATVGAVLPGEFRIKDAKLRGVDSFGMLCAEQELGLAEASDGLWELPADAPIGQDIRQYLQLDDNLIELGLTPNRGDCLSIRGLAREAAAVFGLDQQKTTIPAVSATHERRTPVSIEAAAACPRYVSRVIDGIDNDKASPLWLIEALRRSGVRSLGPVVDVTNFVMLELGQPMHAFDGAQIHGGLVVRQARAGEALTLLDGQVLSLREQSLVIADQTQALALAGIMGGQSSAVSNTTSSIVLEAAFFQPLALAGEARRYGLHTDSSHRFERGVDFELPRLAIERATALLLELVGGEAGPVVEVSDLAQLPARTAIGLRADRIKQVLGFALADADVAAYLGRLGCAVTAAEQGWQVVPPSHRFDLTIEVDLIEELARLYGYNRLPVTAPMAPIRLLPQPENQTSLRRLKRALVDMGYQEAITFSFIEAGLQQQFDPGVSPWALANPLSAELAVMRTSLWPGLAMAVLHNQSRQQNRVRLFEAGLRFTPTADGLAQVPMLAGIVSGDAFQASWNNPKNSLDFFDVKGNIESLLQLCGVAGEFSATTHPVLHPGQSAAITVQGVVVGCFGALHPSVIDALGLSGPVYVFELQQSALLQGSLPQFKPLSRFPAVSRDLALLVPDSVGAAEILTVVRQNAGDVLRDLSVFDVYRGRGVADQHYSLALSLTWQDPERTLLDTEIQAFIENILQSASSTCGALLRS